MKISRSERIVALRREGVGLADIADRVKVSRSTVYRHLKAAGLVGEGETSGSRNDTPETGARAQDGVLIDFPPNPDQTRADHEAARAMLRAKADGGSITAARDLYRVTGAEIARVDPCRNHVDEARVTALMEAQRNLWTAHLLGPLARRLSHDFDLRIDVVEHMMHTAIEAVGREMEAKREAALESKGGRE